MTIISAANEVSMMREDFLTRRPACANDELEKLLTSLSYREICQELAVDGDSGMTSERPVVALCLNGQTQNGSCQQIVANASANKKGGF